VFRHDEWDATIGVHIDDGVIEISPDRADKCIELLSSFVLLKVTGRLDPWSDGSISVPYLGRWRSRIGNTLFKKIDPKYVQESVKILGLERASVAKTPSTKQLIQATSDEMLTGDQQLIYRHVTGKLMHVQEDLYHSQFVIKELAREMIAPTQASLNRLRHLVRFLRGREGEVRALTIDPSSSGCNIFVDSNWASCASTARSTDCITCFLFGAFIQNSVKTQTPIALSSAEAELGGVHRGSIQAMYIQNLYAEAFRQSVPVTIHTDSSAGKVIATRRGVGRVRHLEVRRLFVQQLSATGRIAVRKAKGTENVADMGTKVLNQEAMDKILRALLIGPLHIVRQWLGI